MEETITISKKEYTELLEDQWFLECLKGAGVDNWEGYDEAVRMAEEGD
jgi:hypothetical protein